MVGVNFSRMSRVACRGLLPESGIVAQPRIAPRENGIRNEEMVEVYK